MASINWTDEAERSLREIYKFITRDNPEAAERTIFKLIDKVSILQSFPESGYAYQRIPKKSIRILQYGHYRIAYLLKPNKDIDVLGVFHEKMDIERYLDW